MYKIAIVGKDMITGTIGGGGIVTLILADKLSNLGYNVHGFTNSIKDSEKIHNMKMQKYNKQCCYETTYLDLTPNALGYISPKLFYKEIDTFSPDIIHATSNCPLSLWAMNYGVKHNIPTVFTSQGRSFWVMEHETPFKPNNPLHKLVVKIKTSPFKRIVNNADYVTAVSKIALQDLEQFVRGGGVQKNQNNS